jgi:multidrug efflux pump
MAVATGVTGVAATAVATGALGWWRLGPLRCYCRRPPGPWDSGAAAGAYYAPSYGYSPYYAPRYSPQCPYGYYCSILVDVNTDQQQKGLKTDVVVDRDTASRLGLVMSQIDNTLYDAFGQRQVSVIYSAINQYHVVMEVDPRYWQDPSILNDLYVSTSGASPSGTATSNAVAGTVTQSAALPSPGSSATASTSSQTASVEGAEARNAQTNALANTGRQGTSSGAAVSTSQEPMVPLAAFSHFEPGHTPLAVNHQGLFVASTISFNLLPGVALGDAADEIKQTMAKLHAPATIHGSLQGTARAFEESLAARQARRENRGLSDRASRAAGTTF